MKRRAQKKATTLKPSKKIQFSSIILAEFACTGCLISRYIPTMLLTEVPEPVYPADLDNIEKLILKNVKFETKHTAPVFSSPTHEHPEGYSHCGYFRLARLWKPWENPSRYQEEKVGKSVVEVAREAIAEFKNQADILEKRHKPRSQSTIRKIEDIAHSVHRKNLGK